LNINNRIQALPFKIRIFTQEIKRNTIQKAKYYN